MTDLIYNYTRKEAAKYLGVSTRTIDRYVKGGKLSYKRVSNKIMLNESELLEIKKNDFDINKNPSQISVSYASNDKGTENKSGEDISSLVELLREKDKQIENKNALIFNMQHNIGVLESKLKNTVALPDHTKEKEDLEKQAQKLSFEKEKLNQELQTEKIKNIIFLFSIIVIVGLIIFFSIY